MTPAEAGKLVFMALANYPELAERDMKPTVALWQEALGDLPFNVVKAALLKVLCSSNRFPKVSDIREAATEIVQPIPSVAVAWEEVCKMQRNYSFHQSGNGIITLSPLAQRVVRTIGLWDLYHSNGESTQRTFFKLYESMSNEQKKLAVLPDGIRQLISQGSSVMLLNNGGRVNEDTAS